jgi:hypothetical protein
MYTRDRVRLDADVYYPDREGTFPVLLMRQPYGRAIASTVVYAHPIWYAAQGYIVVIQDVRGRGTSEGEFKLFEHEIEDGEDAVNWAANLPGSSGQVGMYGFSYQGMTQLYAAVNRPPALKALCPAMLAGDLYHDWAYENGAFCLFANLAWGLQIAAETAKLKGDEAAFLRLSAAAKNLPLQDPIPARPQLMQDLAEYDAFYLNWLDRADPTDDYWRRLSPVHFDLDLPMLHIGGWFDPYMRGTWNFYKAIQQRSQAPQHLIVGPWAHLPWGRKLGAIDYGDEAATDCDHAQIAWFDYFLKGIGALNQSIRLFEMGRNDWRSLDQLPTQQTAYQLSSTGLAGMTEQDGKLSLLPVQSNVPDLLVHDPWRPVPASGGHASYPGGSFDRSALDCRSDVLTYTSEPLEQNWHLIGEIAIVIACQTDAPSFDLCAVFSEVKPNGSVYNFSQGYCRKNASPTLERQLVLFHSQPTAIRIPEGSAIRLSLSAACFPAYPVNAGTGESPGSARAIDHQIITIAIYPQNSRILLPISP